MIKIIAACITLSALVFLTSSFSFRYINKAVPDTVKVEGGLISGTVNSSGDVRIFKGIPFAAPPVGNLRWKEPQPVIPWSGVKQCIAFGASPMQGNPVPFGPWSAEYLIPKEPISEDCLYLNVWTGERSTKEKRPVIFWIYGGGFASVAQAALYMTEKRWQKKGLFL